MDRRKGEEEKKIMEASKQAIPVLPSPVVSTCPLVVRRIVAKFPHATSMTFSPSGNTTLVGI